MRMTYSWTLLICYVVNSRIKLFGKFRFCLFFQHVEICMASNVNILLHTDLVIQYLTSVLGLTWTSNKILIFEIQTILDSNTISKFHSWNKKPPNITCKIHETCLQKSFYLFKVIPTLRYHHQSLTKVLVTHWKRDGKEKAPRKPFQ